MRGQILNSPFEKKKKCCTNAYFYHLVWNTLNEYQLEKIVFHKTFVFFVAENIHKLFLSKLHTVIDQLWLQLMGSTSIANIERINKLQKQAARIIFKAEFTTQSTDIYQRLLDERINISQI